MGDEGKVVGSASPTALLCEYFAFPPAKRSVCRDPPRLIFAEQVRGSGSG
jgi:hypothetical protein